MNLKLRAAPSTGAIANDFGRYEPRGLPSSSLAQRSPCRFGNYERRALSREHTITPSSILNARCAGVLPYLAVVLCNCVPTENQASTQLPNRSNRTPLTCVFSKRIHVIDQLCSMVATHCVAHAQPTRRACPMSAIRRQSDMRIRSKHYVGIEGGCALPHLCRKGQVYAQTLVVRPRPKARKDLASRLVGVCAVAKAA